MNDDQRFVVCMRCSHAMTWLEHSRLRAAVDCRCGAKQQFGPGVYVEDFAGYTLDEVQAIRARNTQSVVP